MRAVVQRVTSARVEVDAKTISSIAKGLVALVGVVAGDGEAEIDWMAQKLATLRIFEDGDGKMNLSLADVGGELLVVSNFTVCGDAQKGRRPSFTSAAQFDVGKTLFDQLLSKLDETGIPVRSGEYGADMKVHIVNDGPVTLFLETP